MILPESFSLPISQKYILITLYFKVIVIFKELLAKIKNNTQLFKLT